MRATTVLSYRELVVPNIAGSLTPSVRDLPDLRRLGSQLAGSRHRPAPGASSTSLQCVRARSSSSLTSGAQPGSGDHQAVRSAFTSSGIDALLRNLSLSPGLRWVSQQCVT